MRSLAIIVLLLLSLSGCVILENLDEITILGDYSREKDGQHKQVKEINDHYDALTKTIADGKINDYKNESSFVHSFGDPILVKKFGVAQERWLYRYAIYRFAKDKVYVYFDAKGNLIKWEKQPCPKFF